MNWKLIDKILFGIGAVSIIMFSTLIFGSMMTHMFDDFTVNQRMILLYVSMALTIVSGTYAQVQFNKKQSRKEIITFRGKQYEFVGNSDIQCKCMSNGQKCNQNQMEQLNNSPFVGTSDKVGYLCLRMWKEI